MFCFLLLFFSKLIKREVEIKKLKTEVEAAKNEFTKDWIKLSKEKEKEFANVTNQRTAEQQQKKALQEQV